MRQGTAGRTSGQRRVPGWAAAGSERPRPELARAPTDRRRCPDGQVALPRELPFGRLLAAPSAPDALRVIEDVDEALRTLVRREALRGGDVDVAFDAPTKDWSSRRNAPTVDLYLYDVREDLHRREVMWMAMRNQSGFVTDRRPPPRHYKLSYLVTAWTQRPEDEHRLLSALLSCFVRHERLPEDVLIGTLVGDLPVLATIALPPPSDRPLSDIWSALGGELKPSLDLIITAPLVDGREEAAGPPVMEEPRIRVVTPEAEEAEETRRRARPAAEAEPEPLPDETVRSGTEARPGRTVRVYARRPPRPR